MRTMVSRGVLLIGLAFFHSGCIVLAVGAAGGAAGTAYVMGKVDEELVAPVPSVYEATLAACRDLDLAVLERQTEPRSANVEAEFTDGTRARVTIEEVAEGRSQLTIRVGVVGDEDRARQLWDAMRRHLPRSAWSKEKHEGEKGGSKEADTEPTPRGRN